MEIKDFMAQISILLDSIANVISPLAWPLVVLAIFIIYKTAFSNALVKLASRVKKLGVSGADFESASMSQKTDEENNIQDKSSLEDALKNLPLIKNYNDKLFPELEKGASNENLSLEDFAKTKVTELYLAWHYEKIYRMIYGSQILALQSLNSHGLKSTKRGLKSIYDKAKTEAPEIYEFIKYNEWLFFLQSQSLIIIDGDHVEISIEGQGLLNYISEQNYSFSKVL